MISQGREIFAIIKSLLSLIRTFTGAAGAGDTQTAAVKIRIATAGGFYQYWL